MKRVQTDLDEIFVRYPKRLHLRDGFEMMFDDHVEKQLFLLRNVESNRRESLAKRTSTESGRDRLRTMVMGDTKTKHVNTKEDNMLKVKVKRVCAAETAESDSREMFAISREHARAWSRQPSPRNQNVRSRARSGRTASKTASPSVEQQRSAHVDSVLCHGRHRKYRETIQLGEDHMTIGSRTFCFSEIHSLRIGDASLFGGNPDPDCCLTIVTTKGTVMIEAASRQKRDFWVNAIKTLSISFAKRNQHKQAMKAQMRRSNRCSSEGTFESESSTKPSMTRLREKTKNHIHQYIRMRDDAQSHKAA